MKTKSMTTTAGNLDTILKFVEGFMKAFAIVFAVFWVLLKVFKEKLVSGSFSLDLDFVKLHLSGAYGNISGLVLNHIDVILITGCLGCIAIRYGIRFLRKILSPVKEGRPFDADVVLNLKKLAWVILIGGSVIQLLGILQRVLLINALPMDVIFSSPAIESVEYVFTMNFGFVWVFCLIRFLAQIFAYGTQLQLESDETL